MRISFRAKFLIGLSTLIAVLLVSTIWFIGNLPQFTEISPSVNRALKPFILLAIAPVLIFAMLLWEIHLRSSRSERIQSWLMSVVNFHSDQLKIHGLYGEQETGDGIDNTGQASRWPWGHHHTEYLGHLEAAARKWWAFYDPSDPTTAPTNDMVSDWLQSDRNLSRERAKAIASMLRPDGLPTGPRK